ncbi:MAG TPA: NDP-sugar synthase [Phycisphaerae bacterium]|nr:NDP-sugar synthase [Phycisphaerae bacterium]HOJ74582.1 NDP-sugar synthase [Phycisphaerae bacterium]HOM50481.1 NDP-sugar synthase [Phycisphaerae bacterium]HOQ87586.1 NDP-sugar synthase [Phycisphaerae bacterium]HPP28254.1 NDP-sugar synthase [Phycisphaerae bacterium]
MVLDKNVTSPHGIILAGTQSWGGCVLDEICSRPLLPLLGRPVVWFIVDWLRRSGITQISICGNQNTPLIREQLGDGTLLGVSIDYHEDPMPRGTAGCIRDAAARTNASEIVAVDATVLTDVNLREMLAAHREEGASLTVIAGKNLAVPSPNHLQPAGVYIISRPALEHIPPTTYQDIKEMWIPRLYQNRLKAVSHQIDLTSYVRVLNGKSYLSAMAWAIRQVQKHARLNAGYRRVAGSLVHSSARLAPTARLVGPCVIGPECRVKEGATLIGPVVLGAETVVGEGCILSHTGTWRSARIGAEAVIDRSILIRGSTVEPRMVVRDAIWGHPSAAKDVASLYWWPSPAADFAPPSSPKPREKTTRLAPTPVEETAVPAPLPGVAVPQ